MRVSGLNAHLVHCKQTFIKYQPGVCSGQPSLFAPDRLEMTSSLYSGTNNWCIWLCFAHSI